MKRGPELLPRLLYLSDVPVESSYHGSALVYRLFQNYPTERLRIVETGVYGSLAERRLAGVTYAHFPARLARHLNTRLNRWVSSALVLFASRRAKVISHLLADYRPEAVVTVAHGSGWLTAAKYAQQHNLPLHLVVHDDWPRHMSMFAILKPWLDAMFGRIYRQASSRLCVSPYMRDFYRERYRVEGIVLYPSRASDCQVWSQPSERTSPMKEGLTVAFAGTLNSGGYGRLLLMLAESLRKENGTLLLFGPHTKASLSVLGLNQNNIRCEGLVGSNDLIQRLRLDADVLFVPMSFEEGGHQDYIRAGFPSKLTDYTAAGVPLLICGPDYCSAVRWAQQYQPVAEVVTSECAEALEQALERLGSSEHRRLLATRALEIGKQMFAHAVVEQTFLAALQTGMATKRR